MHVIKRRLSAESFQCFHTLQVKRSKFPRFYFLGDEDLLEILGQATKPVIIQSHLRKLFAGIHTVEFDELEQNVIAMSSLDGEHVPLAAPILITAEVEVKDFIFYQLIVYPSSESFNQLHFLKQLFYLSVSIN